MICFNAKDKFLKDIVAKANASKLIKNKKGKTIGCYGISKDREYDVVIPREFTGLSQDKTIRLLVFIQKMGLLAGWGNHWEQSNLYSNNVVGLGYSLRKSRPLIAAKVIAFIWMAVNNEIDELSEQPKDLTEEDEVPYTGGVKRNVVAPIADYTFTLGGATTAPEPPREHPIYNNDFT